MDRFDWAPMMEGEFIIGALKDGQSVTLEPGGQFELSGAPLVNLHQTCAEVHSHLYQVKTVCKELGVAFLGVGFQPKWSVEDTPVMPKGRYKVMKKYMPTVGTRGLDMMFRTCTIQVNLDFKDEEDMIRKFRTSLALQPIATALFANSPFCDGKPSGTALGLSQIQRPLFYLSAGDCCPYIAIYSSCEGTSYLCPDCLSIHRDTQD